MARGLRRLGSRYSWKTSLLRNGLAGDGAGGGWRQSCETPNGHTSMSSKQSMKSVHMLCGDRILLFCMLSLTRCTLPAVL